MLTCYGHTVRLPHNDLSYLAFRLAVEETLCDIELYLDLEEEPDPPVGYLAEVPFLQQVPLPVQVDLLACTWSRHQTRNLIEASLLDAAIVYAACETAARVINDEPEVAVAYLKGGPRNLDARIIRRAAFRLEEMFESFWDDHDFILIGDLQDTPPAEAQAIKEQLGLTDAVVEPMYEALERWHISPDVAANLEGLLTEEEISDAIPLLTGTKREYGDSTGDEDRLLTGIDDSYHGLMVGPCDPVVAATEAERCDSLTEVITTEDDFDCTYNEWVEYFRDEVLQSAPEQADPEIERNADVMEQVRLATTTGLPDGTRIEQRHDGWIVVDRDGFFLQDPNAAAWVADEDDEYMPPMMFNSPEAAYVACLRSEQAGAARKQRREEALRRLGNG